MKPQDETALSIVNSKLSPPKKEKVNEGEVKKNEWNVVLLKVQQRDLSDRVSANVISVPILVSAK